MERRAKFRFYAEVECQTCGQILLRQKVWVESRMVFAYLVHEKNDDCVHSEKLYEDPTFGLIEL